jgi:hypothetical protein
MPIWCLIGQNSPPYNRSFSDRIAALNPMAQVIELPDQDHGTPDNQPGGCRGIPQNPGPQGRLTQPRRRTNMNDRPFRP